jgi:hypothetical protein
MLRCFHAILFAAFLLPFALETSRIHAGYELNINFATSPNLPSSLGMSYASDASQSENTIMSIVGGSRLSVNTFQLPNDKGAFYYKDNFFDPTLDLEMETVLKIIDSNFFGISFTAYNTERSSNFTINKTGFIIYGFNSGSGYDFTSDFHKFRYKRTAATNIFEFYIDDVLAASGATPSGFSGNQFYFGDGTSTGGNVQAEIRYVKYRNDSFSPDPVPEPTSLAIFSLGSLALWIRNRRKSGLAGLVQS